MLNNITDDDLERLVSHYKNKKGTPEPQYTLKELVEYGLLYLYGDKHYKDGVIKLCGSPFLLFEPHICKNVVVNKESGVTKLASQEEPLKVVEEAGYFQIRWISELEEVGRYSSHSWTGYNIAILSNNSDICAYFKRDFLFKKTCPGATIVAASSKKIFVGTEEGEIQTFDPIKQEKTVKKVHAGPITSISVINDTILSSSMDGTVFFNRRLKVSKSGVLAAHLLDDKSIACACGDYSVSLVRSSGFKQLAKHFAPIIDMTLHDSSYITSSEDGYFGFFKGKSFLGMHFLDSSRHKRINDTSLLCYGRKLLQLYDINTHQPSIISSSKEIIAADVSENILVFSAGQDIVLKDVRENTQKEIKLDAPVTNLSFSDRGRLLLAITDTKAYMLDIRLL